MQKLIGPRNDQFAILATQGTYTVVVFPEPPQPHPEILISASRIKHFAEARLDHLESVTTCQHPDLFIHSLTVEEVAELTGFLQPRTTRVADAPQAA
jgi:hypothetical protein